MHMCLVELQNQTSKRQYHLFTIILIRRNVLIINYCPPNIHKQNIKHTASYKPTWTKYTTLVVVITVFGGRSKTATKEGSSRGNHRIWITRLWFRILIIDFSYLNGFRCTFRKYYTMNFQCFSSAIILFWLFASLIKWVVIILYVCLLHEGRMQSSFVEASFVRFLGGLTWV